MTDVPANLEGGLTEPEELEPAQGSLRLASPDDALRRGRVGGGHGRGPAQEPQAGRGRPRLGRVGQAHPHHPRRHRGCPDRCCRGPRRARDPGASDPRHRLGHPRPHQRRRRGGGQRGRADRPRQRRDLVVGRARRRPRRRRPAARPAGRAARPGAGRSCPAPRPPPPGRSSPSPTTPASTCTPAPTSAPTRSPTTSSRSPRSPASTVCSASSRPDCPSHEQGASDAQELGVAIAAGVVALRALDRGRLHGRAGRRGHRVPARRHRRAVPHDRQAARRAPAVGPRAGG